MSKSALKIVQKYHPNVTSVRDAKRGTRIQVTENDCQTSRTKAPDSCALASAACRKHDGAIISLAVAYLIDGDKATRYRVPSAIAREIVSFDRAKQFAPGTYKLNAPSSNERLGVKRGPRVKSASRGRRIGRRVHKTAGIRTL